MYNPYLFPFGMPGVPVVQPGQAPVRRRRRKAKAATKRKATKTRVKAKRLSAGDKLLIAAAIVRKAGGTVKF
jgi:hypothetical protein